MNLDLGTLDAYDFYLPDELIAQQPVNPRDHSRLMMVDPTQPLHESGSAIQHAQFFQIESHLQAGDVLVLNDTRVMAARLLGRRVQESGQLGGKVEFLLLEQLEPLVWEGLFKGSVTSKAGVVLEFGNGLRGVMQRGAAQSPHGLVVVKFDADPLASGVGEIPLPPYITRKPDSEDQARYQTVYAAASGSAAAPTAGLHFTAEMLERLKTKGVQVEFVTLHIGLGTFRPVKSHDLSLHPMHEERYQIDAKVADRLNEAKLQGRRIIAVGTTALRTLESAALDAGVQAGECKIKAGAGRTRLFLRPKVAGPERSSPPAISPGTSPNISPINISPVTSGATSSQPVIQFVDSLITNFHLPKSTLLMLVYAFGGPTLMRKAYQVAVEQKYRFFSYGDAMWIKNHAK